MAKGVICLDLLTKCFYFFKILSGQIISELGRL